MKYRCAECHRSLLKPAYVHPSGWVLGPKCAAAVGRIMPKARRKAKAAPVAEVQDGQIDLFTTKEAE